MALQQHSHRRRDGQQPTRAATSRPPMRAATQWWSSNIAGTATSADAVLTVNVAPAITTQPQDQNVNQSSNATFSVVATGTPAPTYQWRFNSTDISGATDSTYTRSNAQPADAGSYSVVVSNVAGSVTSTDAIAHRQRAAEYHGPTTKRHCCGRQQCHLHRHRHRHVRRSAISGVSTAPTSLMEPPAPTPATTLRPQTPAATR